MLVWPAVGGTGVSPQGNWGWGRVEVSLGARPGLTAALGGPQQGHSSKPKVQKFMGSFCKASPVAHKKALAPSQLAGTGRVSPGHWAPNSQQNP